MNVIIMYVLMVTPSYFPIRGGSETVVHNLTVELNKLGINTDILTFNMNKKWRPKWSAKMEEFDGIKIFKVPGLNWLPVANSSRIKLGINLIPGRFYHIIKNYDIIHFHEAEFSFPIFSYFIKKPKILHIHGSLDYFKHYQLSKFILKHVADLYISLTKKMKKELTILGIPKNKIVYLPNSVDTAIFCPGKNKADDMILYVGRITPEKGLHVLLESLKYIDRATNLVIIGPLGWSQEYCRKVFRLIEYQGKRGRHKITYMGCVDQSKLIEYYQKATVFVLPSLFEPFGIVLLEALSCETPVISTYTGGIPEVVRNGENGILVPVNNPLKLAKAINYLLQNSDLRRKFGKAGRKWVIENYSIQVIIRKLCKIYENMVKN